MQFIHNDKVSPGTAVPNWGLDPDVVRAIYYEIHRLTAAGKRTKKARADAPTMRRPSPPSNHSQLAKSPPSR